MRNKILLMALVLFLSLVFVSSGLADFYIVKNEKGEIVAIQNQNIFKAEYQELGYTFELWFKTTEKTPSLDNLVKRIEGQLEAQGDIKILDWTHYLDGNYFYVEGLLRNTGRDEIRYIQITAVAYDKSKKLVTLKRSYANPADLKPGQEGTFKIMIKHNARIADFEIRVNWKED